jgi:hypothetical protein
VDEAGAIVGVNSRDTQSDWKGIENQSDMGRELLGLVKQATQRLPRPREFRKEEGLSGAGEPCSGFRDLSVRVHEVPERLPNDISVGVGCEQADLESDSAALPLEAVLKLN